MLRDTHPIRVLYSFPNKLGAQRICYTAWQQVNGLAAAGAQVTVLTGGLLRPVAEGVKVYTTLARGKVRIPYKLIGNNRAMALHDYIVSRRLEQLAAQIDIVHTWPRGALRTIIAAKRLGIPVVLERCNTHTRFAYEVVKKECERLGVALPPDHESAFNQDILRIEEAEFRAADRLLCPSDFVAETFIQQGFSPSQLARHMYGFDETLYYPNTEARAPGPGLTMLFVGVCAVRKGLHYALQAWLQSPACKDGTFLVAGEFLPAYREKLAPMLAHPSVRVLGHRKDIPELMRNSDLLVLPSIEEGSALVTSEARGSGCVLLVSDATGAVCRHMENALVHRVGDTAALMQHITMLHADRALLERLRRASLATVPKITWTAAGVNLVNTYREIIGQYSYDRQNATRAASLDEDRSEHPPVRAGTQLGCRPISDRKSHGFSLTQYVLISPVRDEEQYIEKTLQSVIKQTVRPAEWILVDDGSRDQTGRIIREYAMRYRWIKALQRPDRGRRVAGSGVMEAFYFGYERLRCADWQFIGKLDGDVGLDPGYFESCFERFADDARLGICGGVMYCEENGFLKMDRHPMNHVRGAIKLYRRDCWTDIGGLIRDTGWDTVDELAARMLGWDTRTFSDLHVMHFRPTGAAAGSWNDNVKNGRADYVSGYHPLFILAKCCRRLSQKPYILKSVAHAYGYVSGYLKNMSRVENKDLIRYIRAQQMRRLLLQRDAKQAGVGRAEYR